MDARVAELVRIGSDDALDALYARYASEIQGVAFLILRDRFEAEDVMAETLITAWRRGRDLRDGAALRPWLMRIATNHALAMRRKRRPVAALPELDLPAPDSTGPLAGRIALLAAVHRLPLETRAAVVLHYYADLTVDDVARALGKSPNTVKSQLRVGLEQLRAAWDGGGAVRRFQDVG